MNARGRKMVSERTAPQLGLASSWFRRAATHAHPAEREALAVKARWLEALCDDLARRPFTFPGR